MEEVQRWWQGLDDRELSAARLLLTLAGDPLLLHIQQAQLISATVLSELIYIVK